MQAASFARRRGKRETSTPKRRALPSCGTRQMSARPGVWPKQKAALDRGSSASQAARPSALASAAHCSAAASSKPRSRSRSRTPRFCSGWVSAASASAEDDQQAFAGGRGSSGASRQSLERGARRLGQRRRGARLSVSSPPDGGRQPADRSGDSKRVRSGTGRRHSRRSQIRHGGVTAQILDRTLTSFRIGDPAGAHPIFDATGPTLAPGRWNTPGSPLITSSEHYSTALLEKLVRGSGRLPPNQHYTFKSPFPGASPTRSFPLRACRGGTACRRR